MTLYTTHCPKCKVLEAELKKLGASYDVFTDEDKMIRMGLVHMPVLGTDDGRFLELPAALKYLREEYKK